MATDTQTAGGPGGTATAARSRRERTPQSGESPGEPTLRELFRAVSEGRWSILGAVILAELVAAGYLLLVPPAYRASALLQVEDPTNTPARVENLSPLFDQKNAVLEKVPVEGEIEIVRSRAIVGEAVDALRLDVVAEPRRMPVLGDAIARRYRGDGPSEPRLGLPRFAWGGERIAVERLEVPDELLDRPLTLVATGGDRYEVSDPDGVRVLEGTVGVPSTADVRGGRIDLRVTALEARPGTEFLVERLRRDDVVDRLQEDLRVEERTKNSGAIVVELEGRDPRTVAAVVSELVTAYLKRNAEQRSAETAKTLAYLESQLPEAKRAVESAEAELARYRTTHRSVDLGYEAQATAGRVAELQKTLSDLQAEQEQMRRKYADAWPGLVLLARRISAVEAQLAGLTPRVEATPATELGAVRLLRNVASTTELYQLLLKQVQSLQVVKSGMLGDVRLVDLPTVAHRPVRPRRGPTVALALMLGLGLGFTVAMGRRALREPGLADPQAVVAAVGLPVLASVPHSSREARLRRAREGALLAAAAPDESAIEQLRALRTGLAFLLKARGNVIGVGSSAPDVGKSFVASNLAHLFAASGKRVLLVDADLRRGALHERLGAPARPGLAELLAGDATVEQAIQARRPEGPDLLPNGGPVSNPAELLASPRLSEIVESLSKRYDVVILDTPPALAVTDAVLVARHASVNLLVLRAHRHPLTEISLALERFEQSGVHVEGAVLNEAEPSSGYVYEHPARRRGAGLTTTG